jgi:hypothetical protein
MPFTSFTFFVDHTDQADDLILLEEGILHTVMLGPEHIGTGNAEYYGQLLLVSSETPKPIPIAILASVSPSAVPLARIGSTK